MAPKNLWGELPSVEDVRTPTLILKEQAALLADMTQSVLYGEVTFGKSRSGADKFELELRIVAPALDNYTYDAVVVMQPLALYPLKVWPGWERYNPQVEKICSSADELELALAEILGSDTVRRVIAALIAQSRSLGV